MSATAILVLLAGGWLLLGITFATWMGRRGHSAAAWFALGAVLGPLALPLAMQARRREREASPQVVGSAPAGTGRVDVLVGIDGSREALGALATALALLGERIRRLTLAAVLDYDASVSGEPSDERSRLLTALDAAAAAARPAAAQTLVLPGAAADALTQHATTDGYDLVVVGPRGHGASKALLGSVASKLARRGAVPVLIAGHAPGERTA